MIGAMFRVASPEFNVDGFLKKFKITPSNIWRKGENNRRGNPSNNSGFSICVADSEDWDTHLVEIEEFLTEESDILQEIASMKIDCEIDIGMSVGSNKHFIRSIVIPVRVMKELIKYRIEIRVTGYPSDED